MVAKLKCAKGCGKEFTHQAWKDKHEPGCDGEPAKRRKAPKESRKVKAARELFAIARGSAAVAGDGPIAQAIAQLRAKREEILRANPELQEIERGIAALQAAAAGAGEAAPFPPAAPRGG